MKLAMAQMSMTGSMDENLKKSLAFCDAAAGSDLLFFPEVQLTPFFPQYAGQNARRLCCPGGQPDGAGLRGQGAGARALPLAEYVPRAGGQTL